MGKRIGICLILLLAGSLAAAESATFPLHAGDRVRLRLDSSRGRVIANVLAADDAELSFVCDDSAERYAVPWTSVRKIEVSTGTRSRSREGAVLGAVLLAGLPVAGCVSEVAQGRHLEACVLWVGGSVSLGAAIGGSVFAGNTTDRWLDIRRRGVSIGAAPLRKGAAVRLGIRF